MSKLACIIVTYNRFTKFKKALDAYAKQTVAPDILIVVNNNSMDETTQNYLDKWEQEPQKDTKHVVLAFEDNKGSAGGFMAGCKKAIALGAEWIWLAPDDAYPEEDAIAKLQSVLESRQVTEKTVAICGSVYEEGKPALLHRQRYQAKLWSFKEIPVQEIEYQQDDFEVQLCSSVGLVVRASVIEDIGHVDPAYFIYAADFGYSYQLSQQGQILCVPAIKVIHDPDIPELDKFRPVDWHYYYQVRNYYYFLKSFFPLVYRLQWNKEFSKTRMQMKVGHNLMKNDVIVKALEDVRLDKMGLRKMYRPK